MSRKKTYQKPAIVNLANHTVYGSFDTPMGMCATGASPEGSTYGCGAGGSHTAGTCNFGSFPDNATCSVGSFAGSSNLCATGTSLG